MTDQELAKVEDVAFPAFAAMALANDYFSFDREFAERGATIPGSEEEPLINAVWLCTQWSDVDIEQAKELVRAKTIFYEEEYASRKSAFFSENPGSENLRLCFDGISKMIIGNIAWSLTSPRYYKERRYDANSGVENKFLGLEMT